MEIVNEIRQIFNSILEHHEAIDKLEFSAQTKNGDKIKYQFDRAKYERRMQRQKQAKRKDLFNAIFDILGLTFSISLLVLLIVYSAMNAEAPQVITYALYGTLLIVFFTMSMFYYFSNAMSRTKEFFYNLTGIARFFLIAGTYTPFFFLAFTGFTGWIYLGILWALVALGVFFQSLDTEISHSVANAMALIMVWLFSLTIPQLAETVSLAGVAWLIIGAVFFTLWLASYWIVEWKKGKGKVFTFDPTNLFVLFGSFFYFWTMLNKVMYL